MLLTAYFLVVVPLLVVGVAALWPPRPGRLVVLFAGPLVTLLAFLEVPGVERLGWLAVLGVPWVMLVGLAVVPWRREWARNAVPVTVLAVCALLVGLGRFDAPVLVFVSLPVLLAVGALTVAALSRRDRARAGSVPG